MSVIQQFFKEHGISEVEAERAFDRRGRPCPPQLKKELEAEAAQKFNRRP